jgi:hypothetical protein
VQKKMGLVGLITNCLRCRKPRLESCVINDEFSAGVMCPHVMFYFDFLYDEYVWNTTAANFWINLR